MSEKDKEDSGPSLEIHFIKGAQFRVIHADGYWGGITPSGMLHCAFFSERAPFPTRIINQITKDGRLGAETSRETKTGIVREIDVDVAMSLQTAQGLRNWLSERIMELEALVAAAAVAASKGE